MKTDKSIFTEVVEGATAMMGDVMKGLEELSPETFMKERLTPAQFKQRYGIGMREYEDLRARHGEAFENIVKNLTGR